MAEELGERTEEATPKRRQESREEGQVAKSQDLAGALLLAIATGVVALAAVWMLDQGRIIMKNVLANADVARPLSVDSAWLTTIYVFQGGVRAATPLLLITWLAAALSHAGQIGWLFSPKALQPKLSKLDPISGFKRVFGLSAVVKASLDSVKVLVVVLVSVTTVYQRRDEILVLPYLAMTEALVSVGWLMVTLAVRLLLILLLLGIIDFSYQKWKHASDMKMTKQQVKDEMKQTEGDPEVKRRRLRMQQQIAMQRVSTAVPKADVIVTNPEHISIAIQYDPDIMNAPKVIAKGADHLAMRIRQLAMKHGIPIVERKPLARALYRDVGVGQEVPPDHYKAVAEVLAYVYRLDGRMAAG